MRHASRNPIAAWSCVCLALAVGIAGWLSSESIAAQSCGGVERWAVKGGSDGSAGSINLTSPVTTTVHQLVNLTRPTLPSDDTTRTSAETTVRVVDGRLVKFKLEAGKSGDSDCHMVITDDLLLFSQGQQVFPHGVIAEIVDPGCVAGRDDQVPFPSTFQTQLEAVQTKFVHQFGATIQTDGRWNEADGIPVRITAVGFFDRAHGQTGRAPNGLELHPVLDIEFNPAGSTPFPTAGVAVQNPGFESGNTGWTTTVGVISNDQNQPARTGTFNAWLGGYGEPHTDRLSQSVTIPSSATAASLVFFLRITTEEQTTTKAFDKLTVQVRRSNGQVTVLDTFSNLQKGSSYSLKSYNLTPFRGQTVQIQLVAVEDKGSMTSFLADDFAILIE
jgi:hypothetical protein